MGSGSTSASATASAGARTNGVGLPASRWRFRGDRGEKEQNMRSTLSRRGFLAACATVAGGLGAGGASAAPPKETGLASEGLLVGHPGFQPRTVMPLPRAELPGFLSRAQLDAHHAAYARDVERLREIERQLQDPVLEDSRYGALRREQVALANRMILHELYFGNLAPEPVAVPAYVERHMREHIGSMETWVADFRRCALVAKAWAVLSYDPYDDRWHDAVMDTDDGGIWIGGNPLVVCDVADDAFAKDYGGRADYVARFVDHIDWNEVAKRYRAADRM